MKIDAIRRVYRGFRPFFFITLAGFFLTCGPDSAPVGVSRPVEQFTLPNGMQIVLKENHASSMVTSLVFVKAGSKYESRLNNGVTHFLEHLLFNGTATRTQEEIANGIERLGGYINAFTNKDFTAYLVLMPKEFIDYGLANQADMLFNSVIPEDKIPKERGIVIEEIRMGNDAETAPAESFFEEKAMAGTPYERPIIGYESIIANIPREAIIDYYKSFYAPNNMMALIIGDFEPSKMRQLLENTFGKFPRVELPAPPQFSYQPLSDNNIYRTAAATKSTYINLSLEAPHYLQKEYFAFTLLADYLGDRDASPLAQVLMAGPNPMAGEVSAYLETKEEFSRFNIQIITESTDLADSIMALTEKTLADKNLLVPLPEVLEGYKVSRRCQEIYLSEKLHYYGFMKAPLLAVTGWDFFSTLQDNIDSVTAADFMAAADRYLNPPRFVATVVYPTSGEKDRPFVSVGPSEKEVKDYYAQLSLPVHNLEAGKDFRMPETGQVAEAETRHASYLREILPNGLTVIIKSNPDSRVFALNVLGKSRSATEPDGQDGITDFVNRLIERGTVNRTAEQLSRDLAAIGAQVTLYDNPWIPYDDRYTSRRFSFMKFETIDQFAAEGLKIFAEMVRQPRFDSVEVEKVRQEMMGLLGRNSGSPYKVGRDKFYATLFKGTPYAKTIEGTFRSIGTIQAADLKAHHARMYSPENMIITVGTNEDPAQILAMLKEEFGAMPAIGYKPPEMTRPDTSAGVARAHEKMEKEQVYIYLGHLLPDAFSPEAAALDVAGEILSRRLADTLREKQGLAYSVGASVNLDQKLGWLVCSMGTGLANYEKALSGILAQIEGLKKQAPSAEELETAVNSLWGSYLTANLSRINQAYYMAVYEFMGLGYNYGDKYIGEIRKVTPEQVQAAAQKYFDTRNYVLATAGNI